MKLRRLVLASTATSVTQSETPGTQGSSPRKVLIWSRQLSLGDHLCDRVHHSLATSLPESHLYERESGTALQCRALSSK